jgi:hypothetical protein
MIVLLSAVRLVTAPFHSTISFDNTVVQLGVGGMYKVFNWVSNITSVSTANRLARHSPGAAGTVYARGGANGPTDEEITKPSLAWLKANRPGALDSKVEADFRRREYLIVWSPP